MNVMKERLPAKLAGHSLSAGRPDPLGATFDGEGVNFAVFSAHAEMVELCLFTADGSTELARIPLKERDGDVWHVHVAGLGPGTRYGYRVHGPYKPEEGHRFNPNKLLLDPYAKKLAGKLQWNDAVYGYIVNAPKADLTFDPRDSAPFVPKSEVADPSFQWGDDKPPRVRRSETVIYEAHARGLTQSHPDVDPEIAGTYRAVASEPMLEHMAKLGITTVELLPIHAFLDDRFLVQKRLRNYWGYQSIGFFAPEPRYMEQGALWEFQTMVRRLHAAGFEVILDVVYNHTAEGGELGPTLCFRGLDNASYYRLTEGGRYYINDTGTGNTLNVSHPAVLRMVMDSLRYWVEVMHVDGFRFDLAATLGREGDTGFDPNGGFLDAIRQDPVLNKVKLIAEPWDIGPGGYQLGAFPHPFYEWNDKFRDGVRRYWRGDEGMTGELASRLLGSAENFDHSGRSATSSVNFITAHDGFTLQDLVSYTIKRNLANGEGDRDGKDENYSDNMGLEGPTSNPRIRADRAQRKRNMLSTMFLAQGTPMLLAGDEIGNSQGGNNNAYAQDNQTGWIDWVNADWELFDFVTKISELRRAHPVLRQRLFLHSRPRRLDGLADLFWRMPDGKRPTREDWQDTAWKTLCVEIRTSSGTPDYAASDDVIFAVFNAGDTQEVTLPPCPEGLIWEVVLDTTVPDAGPHNPLGKKLMAPAQSVLALQRVPMQETSS
ncbi:glycogen debranching protein GlgX [Psychromarinibacter sp. S121]|uniref:glycogen debranching protein GlgX n=1 Tax=Psychromarinibacter sp. S121 TaxID=3415127 RepID=UPI003C7D5364